MTNEVPVHIVFSWYQSCHLPFYGILNSSFFHLQIIDCLLFDQVFHDGIEALQVSYKKLNPFCVPFATSNMGAAMLAIDLVSYLLDEIKIWLKDCFSLFIQSWLKQLQGWMGPSYSISTACATSNFCILSAANHIIRGETVSGWITRTSLFSYVISRPCEV